MSTYMCLNCGSMTSVAFTGPGMPRHPGLLVGTDGEPLGCAHCGENRWRRQFEQLNELEETAGEEKGAI